MSFWQDCRALHAELVERVKHPPGPLGKKAVVSQAQAPSRKKVTGTHGQPGQERMTAKEYREMMGLG